MKASLSNYRQSPRKVRLVADLIRGKSVESAKRALTFLPKKSAPDMLQLLDSAVANARELGLSAEDLMVKMIAVNKGNVLRRFMPKARGRAARFARTMSIITLELGAVAGATPKKAAAKKTARKTTKKTAKKDTE